MIVGNNAYRFDTDCMSYRQIAISGSAYGSGKTLLAVAMAERWRSRQCAFGRRYYVLANLPTVFSDPILPEFLDDAKGIIWIFDEAGARYSSSRDWQSSKNKEFLSVADYSRKQDYFFLYPTATMPDKNQRRLLVYRNITAARFLDPLGLGELFWFYWVLPSQEGEQNAYNICLLCPYAYYGTFSTGAIPGAYADALVLLVQKFQEKYKFDAEAAKLAAEAAEAELRAGRVVDPPRPSEEELIAAGLRPRPVRSAPGEAAPPDGRGGAARLFRGLARLIAGRLNGKQKAAAV